MLVFGVWFVRWLLDVAVGFACLASFLSSWGGIACSLGYDLFGSMRGLTMQIIILQMVLCMCNRCEVSKKVSAAVRWKKSTYLLDFL